MISPWELAAAQPLSRGNQDVKATPLDPGVRYFVRMLEKLGYKTEWSCEGHPKGFYIVFHGPERIAREIVAAGVFSVNLWSHGGWVMTLEHENIADKRRKPWTEEDRRSQLGFASWLWETHFDELGEEEYPESLVVEPRDRTARALRQLAIRADIYMRNRSDDSDEGSDLILAIEDAYAALAADPQTIVGPG